MAQQESLHQVLLDYDGPAMTKMSRERNSVNEGASSCIDGEGRRRREGMRGCWR